MKGRKEEKEKGGKMGGRERRKMSAIEAGQ